MSSKRPVVLMGILLALVLAYVAKPAWEPYVYGTALHAAKPLAGKNSVSGLKVQRDANGRWMATLDYFYTGEPMGAYLLIKQLRDTGAGNTPTAAGPGPGGSYVPVQRGSHHASVELQRSYTEDILVTKQIVAELLGGGKVIASQTLAQTIIWPDYRTWYFDRQLAGKTPDELLKQAVAAIDNASTQPQLDEAKRILERLIARDAQFDAAYVELARVAMKSNWGPEGLHQAENFLASALRIRPDSVNAKILLGYVYSHQQRYKESEALFVQSAQTDTKNLWLWANWGELLAMQGKLEQSEQKYREAVTRPRPNDTYDRARLDAYAHLLALLERRKDLDGMEALHKQRAEEFGPSSCYSAEYARFLLQQRGDTTAAIALARQSLDANCGIPAREVLGLAHYVVWANTTSPQRDSSLDQARIFLPAGPRLLYLLATSDRTVTAAQRLVAAGESIEQLDNDKLNALAHALGQKDLVAARRLMKLGARADAPIGEDNMPVALLPVMSTDISAIHLMQKLGVDYSKLRYRGATAIDYAKQMGDSRLLKALTERAQIL